MALGGPFIKIISYAIARRIESGNSAFAALGAAIGLAGGVGAGWFLWKWEMLETLGPAAIIALSIVGCITGAMIGAGIARPQSIGRRINAPGATVRANNLNHVLATPIILMVLVAAGAGIIYTSGADEHHPSSGRQLAAAGAAAAGIAICILAADRMIVRLAVGQQVTVARLFSSRQYRKSDIQIWGLPTNGGTLTHVVPPDGTFKLIIVFTDQKSVSLQVSAFKATALAEAINRMT